VKRPFLLKKRGKYWHVRFAGERDFHSTGFTNRKDAESFARIRARSNVSVVGLAPTLQSFAKSFFLWDRCKWVARQRAKNRPFSKAVAENRRGQLVNHILPRFGYQRLNDITAVEIEDWLVSLPLANQTRNHILYSLSIILREAKRDGLIDDNPAEAVEPMGKDFAPTVALTTGELHLLFPVNAGDFRSVWPQFQFGVMFTLMVSSGIRPGEARALEWSAVILDIPAVLVVQAVTGSDEIGPTKGKWKRGVIIPGRTAELLRHWQRECGRDTGFVFCGKRGEFWSRKETYNRFREGLVRAGIQQEDRHISMRCLRTTYNTRMRQILLANAMPEDFLRFFIGHRSVQMTDRYDNPQLEAKLRAMRPVGEQVNGFWN